MSQQYCTQDTGSRVDMLAVAHRMAVHILAVHDCSAIRNSAHSSSLGVGCSSFFTFIHIQMASDLFISTFMQAIRKLFLFITYDGMREHLSLMIALALVHNVTYLSHWHCYFHHKRRVI